MPIRLELDVSSDRMTPEMSRYIKSLSFFRTDTSEVSNTSNGKAWNYHTLESTEVFDSGFVFPSGYNHYLGSYGNIEENTILFHYYNDNHQHFIGRITADSQTVDMVYQKACLNFQLNPENFIHEGAAYLEVFKYNDPITGQPRRRSYYNFTDGYNDMRFICIEDAIATRSFNKTIFPYFQNPHDECLMINAGVPKPVGCIKIKEVPNDDPTKQNELRFNTWQFMVQYVDVYGRPSEWSDISDLYVPGENDCIGASDLLPRCLDLTFDAGYPLVNIINIAFRNCNNAQWYQDTSLFLYNGTNLGNWWERTRNSDINFNPATNEITYRFCKDKECNPIPQAETNRTQNPLPRVTQSVAKVGKFIQPVNNMHGFFPFDSAEMDKLSLTITKPSIDKINTGNIEIYVPVMNPFNGSNQPVWTNEGKGVFGGLTIKQLTKPNLQGADELVPGLITDYHQNFTNEKQRGFIGYLAGTGSPPIATISEQYYVDNNGDFQKVEDYDAFVFNRRGYFQKFTFNSIARGKYVFRIAGHESQLTDVGFDKTSTYTAGVFSWNAATKKVSLLDKVSLAKELVIDICVSDYSSLTASTILTIYDLTNPQKGKHFINQIRAARGYVYESASSRIPVELLKVYFTRAGDGYEITSLATDHNGFYFVADNQTDQLYHIDGYCGCGTFQNLAGYRTPGATETISRDVFLDESTCTDYSKNICNRVQIKGKVTTCDTGIPVPGIGVVYTRGGTAMTGADGTFTIIAHDAAMPSLSGIGFGRIDDVYFSPVTCPFTDCNGNCLPNFRVSFDPCTVCDERNIDVPAIQVKTISRRGLLSSGQYGVSVWGNDWLGRHGFAQVKKDFYVTMPSLIDTKIFAPSTITINIPPTMTFPDWITELSFGITKELSMGGTYITWIVDRVEFIDNTGKKNDTNPTQIKVYYASLNEYNIQNNFNTTTHWQFIVQAAPQLNYTSDFVEFYMNGDGTFYNKTIRALVKYDQTGQYFLIDYDSSLKDLQPFALIRLGRPQDCATKGLFYQLCGTVKVINGKAQAQSVTLNAFDTYYKYRQIPVPVPIDDTQTENTIRTFGFPFEHHSPSDFWGDHCINIGKPNASNPYESEIIRENQAMLSGAMSVNGQLNYLNYFDDALAVDFDSWDFGGIVSAIPFVGGVYYICRFNCFVVGFNDNMLRVNENGQVTVPSADTRFGNPEVKIGGNYGCSFFDKNTIQKKDGYIQFVDSREGGLVQSTYGNDVLVSKVDASKNIIGGVDSWMRTRIKYIQQWNKTHVNKKYFVGGIDPAARQYLLSIMTIRSNDFLNDERDPRFDKHETLSFDYLNRLFRAFMPFTPQGYARMEGQSKDVQLFSFADKIYTHYSTSGAKTYGTIYGRPVTRVIRVSVVLDNFQKTMFNNNTVMCKHLYFCDIATTDSGQRTRMLKAAYKQGDYYWGGPVLCNLDSPVDSNFPGRDANNLMDGQKMYGSVLEMRFIGNPDDDTTFTELTGFIVEVQAEGKVLAR